MQELWSDFSEQLHLFPASSGRILDIPVMLFPGCARLATKPLRTGSPTPIITIGIVVVAFFAGLDHRSGANHDEINL